MRRIAPRLHAHPALFRLLSVMTDELELVLSVATAAGDAITDPSAASVLILFLECCRMRLATVDVAADGGSAAHRVRPVRQRSEARLWRVIIPVGTGPSQDKKRTWSCPRLTRPAEGRSTRQHGWTPPAQRGIRDRRRHGRRRSGVNDGLGVTPCRRPGLELTPLGSTSRGPWPGVRGGRGCGRTRRPEADSRCGHRRGRRRGRRWRHRSRRRESVRDRGRAGCLR